MIGIEFADASDLAFIEVGGALPSIPRNSIPGAR
jgi:hypothetical protein